MNCTTDFARAKVNPDVPDDKATDDRSASAGLGLGLDETYDCSAFYEWNARVQITSWHPVHKGEALPLGHSVVDYARVLV
jgi:hypothetical protein